MFFHLKFHFHSNNVRATVSTARPSKLWFHCVAHQPKVLDPRKKSGLFLQRDLTWVVFTISPEEQNAPITERKWKTVVCMSDYCSTVIPQRALPCWILVHLPLQGNLLCCLMLYGQLLLKLYRPRERTWVYFSSVSEKKSEIYTKICLVKWQNRIEIIQTKRQEISPNRCRGPCGLCPSDPKHAIIQLRCTPEFGLLLVNLDDKQNLWQV